MVVNTKNILIELTNRTSALNDVLSERPQRQQQVKSSMNATFLYAHSVCSVENPTFAQNLLERSSFLHFKSTT